MEPGFHRFGVASQCPRPLDFGEHAVVFGRGHHSCIPFQIEVFFVCVRTECCVLPTVLKLDGPGSHQSRPVTLLHDTAQLIMNTTIAMRRDAESVFIVMPCTEDASDDARPSPFVQSKTLAAADKYVEIDTFQVFVNGLDR